MKWMCILGICGVLTLGVARAQDAGDQKGLEITAAKEATFDSDAHIATFVGDVKVVDPQFTLTSEELRVELLKDGGMKRAEATGNVIIVSQKESQSTSDSKPTKSTGKAERAIYEPATGDVTLIGWPQIQQGINLHIATEASTRMVLNRNGKMKTFGRSKTIIKEQDGVTNNAGGN
jgi:lipopolysaccharide transport protein LptA